MFGHLHASLPATVTVKIHLHKSLMQPEDQADSVTLMQRVSRVRCRRNVRDEGAGLPGRMPPDTMRKQLCSVRSTVLAFTAVLGGGAVLRTTTLRPSSCGDHDDSWWLRTLKTSEKIARPLMGSVKLEVCTLLDTLSLVSEL